MTPQPPPASSVKDPVPYPDKHDRKIREAAEQAHFGMAPAVALDLIKKLLGDYPTVRATADAWLKDTTMNASRDKVVYAQGELSSYWTGPAFRAFDRYATDVANKLNNNKEITAGIGTALMDCVETVISVYGAAVVFIFTCVAELIPIGIGIALTTPATAEATVPYFVYKMIDALSGFVKSIGNLIKESLLAEGKFMKAGGAFKGAGSRFQTPTELSRDVNDPENWDVIPNGK